MFDSTVFFSTYVALLAAFATMEVCSFTLGLYLNKRQMKRQQAFEAEWAAKVASGEIPEGMNPMQMMMGGMGGMPGGMPMPYPMPTASGEEVPEPVTTGQYL